MEEADINSNSHLEQEQEDFFDFIESENVKMINEILDHNYQIWLYRSKENDNSTILHISVFKKSYDITEKIINYVEEKNKEGLTTFINEKNEQGVTAIHYASFRGNVEIIKLLERKGADIYEITKRKLNIFHYACQGNRPNSIMHFYLQFKKTNDSRGLQLIKEQDSGKSTPLHWAAYSKAEDALLYLINLDFFNDENEKQEYIDKKDGQGYTALHLSTTSKSPRIVMKLLQNGATPDIEDKKGKTPLDLAISKKQNEIVEILRNNQRCQICNVKAPVKQIKKSTKNIFLVFLFQLSTTFILFISVISNAFDTGKNGDNILYNILFIIYVALLFLFFIIYIILLIRDPGIIQPESEQRLEELLNEKKDLIKYCYKCFVLKTKNSKHCIICNKCYDNFDHHCYWINKCVAGRNYCLFLFFLIETFLYLGIVLAIAILGLIHSFKDDDHIFHFFYNFQSKNVITKNVTNQKALNIALSIIMILIDLFFLIPEALLLILHIRVCHSNYKEMRHSQKNKKRKQNPTLIETSLMNETSIDFNINE